MVHNLFRDLLDIILYASVYYKNIFHSSLRFLDFIKLGFFVLVYSLRPRCPRNVMKHFVDLCQLSSAKIRPRNVHIFVIAEFWAFWYGDSAGTTEAISFWSKTRKWLVDVNWQTIILNYVVIVFKGLSCELCNVVWANFRVILSDRHWNPDTRRVLHKFVMDQRSLDELHRIFDTDGVKSDRLSRELWYEEKKKWYLARTWNVCEWWKLILED